jgi:predicted nuclease of restriction endonuclease-like (RecB) superfamily
MEEKAIVLYRPAADTIKTAILQGQYEAAKGVNRIQLAVYFGIGKYVSLNTRKGVWGTGALEAISQILRKELPGLKGYSATQLREMRLFYEAWQILDPNSSVMTDESSNQEHTQSIPANSSVMTDELQDTGNQIDIYHAIQIPNLADFPVEDFFKVPFTHHTLIRAIKSSLEARYYYIHRTAEEHLTTRTLEKLIKDDAYGNQDKIPSNFSLTIPKAELARKAVMMFKDSYLLDFINVEQIGEREAIDVDERVVEQQIVQNVKQFIMTFGRDFTFVGNQYHLEVYGVEHFPDLLFFNRELNALVVVELKTGEFKTSYLGQLMGYLSILDAKVKKPHENPAIGIVLCKEANREFVEFVIRDYNKPMGVATYKTTTDMPEELRKTLPDIEELKKLL